jgi:hypothetical protein
MGFYVKSFLAASAANQTSTGSRPDSPKLKHKARNRPVTLHRACSFKQFRLAARPINLYCLPRRIDEPCQLGSILEPGDHLRPQIDQAVGRGTKLDYEVRTDWAKRR